MIEEQQMTEAYGIMIPQEVEQYLEYEKTKDYQANDWAINRADEITFSITGRHLTEYEKECYRRTLWNTNEPTNHIMVCGRRIYGYGSGWKPAYKVLEEREKEMKDKLEAGIQYSGTYHPY